MDKRVALLTRLMIGFDEDCLHVEYYNRAYMTKHGQLLISAATMMNCWMDSAVKSDYHTFNHKRASGQPILHGT